MTLLLSSTMVLQIRKRLGRKDWAAPEELRPGIWYFQSKYEKGRVMFSIREDLETPWIQASIAYEDRLPTYEEVKLMYQAVFNDGYAYQVFVPESNHVNFHSNALHLWGRLDGKPMLPEFSVQTSLGPMV